MLNLSADIKYAKHEYSIIFNMVIGSIYVRDQLSCNMLKKKQPPSIS